MQRDFDILLKIKVSGLLWEISMKVNNYKSRYELKVAWLWKMGKKASKVRIVHSRIIFQLLFLLLSWLFNSCSSLKRLKKRDWYVSLGMVYARNIKQSWALANWSIFKVGLGSYAQRFHWSKPSDIWASGFLKSPQLILICSQVQEHCSRTVLLRHHRAGITCRYCEMQILIQRFCSREAQGLAFLASS